jgi:thioesterase domain-containing protein/acyl carrier protein
MGNRIVPSNSPVEAEAQRVNRSDLNLSTPFEEPQTESELKLAAIWADVLGVNAIGASDNFFRLGGDSFAATTLAAEIEATFGLRFAPSDIINHSTIAKQARVIDAKVASLERQLPPSLVAGSTRGSKSPVFMVHGGSGFAFLRPVFIDVVGEDRPVYFFQAPGLDGRTTPLGAVEDIARLYVQSMRVVQPNGPYNIVAMCSGAFIALELCNQIEEAGESIGHLVLLDPDTMPPAWKEQRARPGTNRRMKTALDRIPPERRAHVTDAMLKVVHELREAICNYVPRPYSGNAAMLVNSRKAKKIIDSSAFWQTHLGSLSHKVYGANHDELFQTQLPETALFVRNALDN